MSVLSEREGDVRVAQALTNNVDWHPSFQQERGVSVTCFVDGDPHQTRSADVAVPPCRRPIRIQRLAILPGEDQTGVFVGIGPLDPFGELLNSPPLEDLDGHRVEVDSTSTSTGFGRTLDDLATLAGPLAGKGHGLSFEVEVRTTAEEFRRREAFWDRL